MPRRADREIGLQIEAAPGYRPEPEIAIIDDDYDDERYAARFYGVVEVLSATDLARNPRTGHRAIDDKLAFCRSHPNAGFVLVVAQDTMAMTLHSKGEDGRWSETTIIPTRRSTCRSSGRSERWPRPIAVCV